MTQEIDAVVLISANAEWRPVRAHFPNAQPIADKMKLKHQQSAKACKLGECN